MSMPMPEDQPLPGLEIEPSSAHLSRTALELPADMSFEEWSAYGQRLSRMAEGVMWWLGDWWRYGERRYGERASQALDADGYSYQTLRSAGYVAGRFEPFRRLNNLTWSHHLEVAALDPGEADKLLTEAASEGWSTRELRAEVSLRKRRRRAREESARFSTTPILRRMDAVEWLGEQDECDLLLTDPPYSTDVQDITEFANWWLPLALSKVKPTGRAYVCIGAYPEEIGAYLAVARGQMTLADVLVWTYRNTLGPSPTYDYKLNWQAILYYRGPDAPPLDSPEMVEQFSVQDINAPDGRLGDRWHAWQKPDLLGERFVRHATRAGDLVLDPFAGTGTFLLAAARLGRRALGCDINDENIGIARERGVSIED